MDFQLFYHEEFENNVIDNNSSNKKFKWKENCL